MEKKKPLDEQGPAQKVNNKHATAEKKISEKASWQEGPGKGLASFTKRWHVRESRATTFQPSDGICLHLASEHASEIQSNQQLSTTVKR